MKVEQCTEENNFPIGYVNSDVSLNVFTVYCFTRVAN